MNYCLVKFDFHLRLNNVQFCAILSDSVPGSHPTGSPDKQERMKCFQSGSSGKSERSPLRTRFDQNQKRQSAWCLNRALKMELSAFPLIAIRVLSRSPSNSSYSFPNNELHKEIQNSFAFNFSRRSESPETSAPKKETPHGVPFLHYDQINLK